MESGSLVTVRPNGSTFENLVDPSHGGESPTGFTQGAWFPLYSAEVIQLKARTFDGNQGRTIGALIRSIVSVLKSDGCPLSTDATRSSAKG
jgi:hypothetical protein